MREASRIGYGERKGTGQGLDARERLSIMARELCRDLTVVSSLCKYLHNVESVDRGERDLVSVTRSAVARGKYHLTRRMIYGAKRPFWDYWEDALDFMVDVEPSAWKGVA